MNLVKMSRSLQFCCRDELVTLNTVLGNSPIITILQILMR